MTHGAGGDADDADDVASQGLCAWAVPGIGEVVEGTDLAALLCTASLQDGDVVLVTSKIVSKAEGRTRAGDRETAVLDETVRVVARRGATAIVENHLGLVMAAAGVDATNVAPGHVVLLPRDPDSSARVLRESVRARSGINVALVITDTAGRAWRTGQTDLAVGVAGIDPLDDHAGRTDAYGNPLLVTAPAVADELAGAAELVTGKLTGLPVAVVRGLGRLVLPVGEHGPGARGLVRPRAEDMFALGAREAVVAAVGGTDLDCFGTPAEPDELVRSLEACGLTCAVTGRSVRVLLPGAGLRDQVAAAERVRLLAHAHGWLPHSDTDTRDDAGDHVTISPPAP